MKQIYLKITHPNGGSCKIGNWKISDGEEIDKEISEDIGWHVIYSIKLGSKVEILIDE